MPLIDVYGAALADSLLRNRAIGAAIVAQTEIRAESAGTANHANRLIWADALVADVRGVGDVLWMELLQSSTVIDAIINETTVSDAAIQAVVNASIDSVALG